MPRPPLEYEIAYVATGSMVSTCSSASRPRWNRGIGTRAVSLMCDYLFGALAARTITLDPEAWNTRAIRCYEKCGFRKIKLLPAHELHEGQYRDCWIMARQP